MLVQFGVKNFLSFKNRVTLSLVASADKEHEENTFTTPGRRPIRLLKSVALYGANASGKSNLVRALAFFVKSVRTSALRKVGAETGVIPPGAAVSHHRHTEHYYIRPDFLYIVVIKPPVGHHPGGEVLYHGITDTDQLPGQGYSLRSIHI